MGYFPNGTSGGIYYEKYCSRCVHDNAGEGEMCAIWSAHLLHNYEECNKPDSILHMLIPLDEDGFGNGQCRLFRPTPEPGE